MTTSIFKTLFRTTVFFLILFGIYHIYTSRKLDMDNFNG